jgi:hypothetical protein
MKKMGSLCAQFGVKGSTSHYPPINRLKRVIYLFIDCLKGQLTFFLGNTSLYIE